MKFKIDIDIDWLDDECNLDDAIRERVIDSLTQSFKAGISKNVGRKVNARVSSLVDSWIMEQLHLFCDRRIAITDKWGDTTEHHESVSEMFKAKFDGFFNASVGKDGKELAGCGYGNNRRTRIDHMLEQKAAEYMKTVTDDMDRRIKNAVDAATKLQIEEKIKKHVIDKVGSFVAD